MTKLSQSILKKIKETHIMPRPKWQFIVMHIALWIIVIISIILGSLAMSVIFRILGGTDWEVARLAGKSPIRSFMLIVPYVWFIFLSLIVFISSKLFAKTKTGYRHQPIFITLTSVAISLIIGALFYFVGVGHILQQNLIKIGPYGNWQQMRNQMMFAPENGVLVGKIIKIDPNTKFIVIDFKSEEWTVDIRKTKFKNNIRPQVNTVIGIIGKKTGNDSFAADKIVPWQREFIQKLPPGELKFPRI